MSKGGGIALFGGMVMAIVISIIGAFLLLPAIGQATNQNTSGGSILLIIVIFGIVIAAVVGFFMKKG
jgi:hypothetical protein